MVIGLRCSNKDYSFAIVDGNKNSPVLVDSGTIHFPNGFSRPAELKWFYQELDELSRKYKIDKWGIKGAEAMAQKGKLYTSRAENEAIVFLLGANKGNENVFRKVKATIAKDLGCKGKAKYLVTDIDITSVVNYAKTSEKINEAILVAWSCL
ncbi:MAG: hypothetical protein HND52_02780 [Ignavibacteriae bacterium]|nr:hypothetical protein [Ignavibacteriota bacterium]NOG96876.1 hypothetical protein [Ignavibacteriota bacterium]